MIISNITPPQVWSASARSLTNFGSGALANGGISQTSLAASATVDLRPSVGIFAQTNIGVRTGVGATGTSQILLTDGPNAIQMAVTAAAASSPTSWSGPQGSTQGFTIKNNDAAVAAVYLTSAYLLTV